MAARRLERAIGVIYRPDTERLSHYFDASLPNQFDEWIWFDETTAVRPLTTQQSREHEAPHPFARTASLRRFWSARVSLDYRALAVRDGDDLLWFCIGHHREYDRLIGR